MLTKYEIKTECKKEQSSVLPAKAKSKYLISKQILNNIKIYKTLPESIFKEMQNAQNQNDK